MVFSLNNHYDVVFMIILGIMFVDERLTHFYYDRTKFPNFFYKEIQDFRVSFVVVNVQTA
jgi:hypothetical protein